MTNIYPSAYGRLLRHWALRFGTFILGVVLLYAPAALLTRMILYLSGSPLVPDAHRVCLRMPVQWLAQPWMYATMLEQPAYLVVILVLPAVAFFFSPLFCGWMCPAGHMTEFLSRLVPPRFQLDPRGRFSGVPVRYGFTVGMMGAALVGGNVCCSFCNFTHAQNLISALFGDSLGISYWASFSVVSFVLWFVVLGLFTKGGRGWCNLLCPAGALQGLAHAIGSRLRIGRLVRIDQAACRRCRTCVSTCPTWAIAPRGDEVRVDSHACDGCMDCVQVCAYGAISYGTHAAYKEARGVEQTDRVRA